MYLSALTALVGPSRFEYGLTAFLFAFTPINTVAPSKYMF